jgi:hypothetical protein
VREAKKNTAHGKRRDGPGHQSAEPTMVVLRTSRTAHTSAPTPDATSEPERALPRGLTSDHRHSTTQGALTIPMAARR